MPRQSEEQIKALAELYRTTHDVRLRTRAQMVLLVEEQHLSVGAIAAIVRESEGTVRCWLKRYVAEGIAGLRSVVGGGAPVKVTQAYKDQLLQVVRRRPRSLGQPYSMWTLQRLVDYMAEQTGIRVQDETVRVHLKAAEIVLECAPTYDQQPRPGLRCKKKTIEATRDSLKAGDVFYYADEFNLSWFPTLRAMWSPKGQQVMISTPAQPTRHYGIGAVNYHTGETVVRVEAPQAATGDC